MTTYFFFFFYDFLVCLLFSKRNPIGENNSLDLHSFLEQ